MVTSNACESTWKQRLVSPLQLRGTRSRCREVKTETKALVMTFLVKVSVEKGASRRTMS